MIEAQPIKNYVTVDTPEKYFQLYETLLNADVVAIDTETNSLNVRKGVIIGASFTTKVGEGYYLPTMKYSKSRDQLEDLYIHKIKSHDALIKILKLLHGKKLIAHNASFDFRFIKNFYKIDLLESLWIDTALLVHTVQEEGAFGHGSPFALKSIARSIQGEIGLDVDKEANEEQIILKESITKNGGSVTRENYEIYKADMEILSQYASADTDLTLRICKYYLAKLVEEDLEKFFFEDEVMPLYKYVTIPMEEVGVNLDLDLIKKTHEEILQDLEENRQKVIESIIAIPEAKQWVVDNAIAAFPPKNKGTYAQRFVETYKDFIPIPLREGTETYDIRKATLQKLPQPHNMYTAFLIDPTDLEGEIFQGENNQKLLAISITLWKESNDGEWFNIQSKKHLSEIVFDYMKIKPISQTKKGQSQFDDNFIEELGNEYDWADNLRTYNKLVKINSTYVERFLDRHEDGRYYFYYKQNGTVSGRYGSDAQQLPKPKEEGEAASVVVKYNNRVRQFMTAIPGRVFIDCDYEALEPHCFSDVGSDKGLQEIFEKGHDFYSTVAIKTEGLKDVSPAKSAPNFLGKVDPLKRNKAKAYSLGIAYGMGDFALGKTLNIPTKEASKLVEGYLSGFPGLRKWREESRKTMKETGMIASKVGRVRHLNRGKAVYDLFGEKILDWNYKKSLVQTGQFTQAEILQCYRDLKNALNNCLNFQIQSLAASVVNRAAIAINLELKRRGLDAIVCAQIHDQLIIDTAEDIAEEVAVIVQDKMENTTKLAVRLKAPPEIAKNWYDGH